MDMTKEDVTCTVSKSGRNLNARIPDGAHNLIGRGDKVKIVVIEKATVRDPKTVRKEINRFIDNPNGEKIRCRVMGYEVVIPLARLVKAMARKKAEKLFYEAIMGCD